jgi:hypothetical protein
MGKRVIDLGTGEHDFLAGRVGDASRFHTLREEAMTMVHMGVDLHKRVSQIAVLTVRLPRRVQASEEERVRDAEALLPRKVTALRTKTRS